MATSDQFLVNTYTTNSQSDSSVTALEGGGFVITWTSDGQDTSGNGIYGQRYDASGNKVGSEFQINTYITSDQSDSSVTGLADGGFVVTWTSFGQDGSSNGVYGQRYDSNGSSVGSEFLINSFTDRNQVESSVTALNDGGFVVTWTSPQVIGFPSTRGQRYNASGARVGNEFLINDGSNDTLFLPSVTGLADGGFVVTWTDSNGVIYGQRYNTSGDRVGNDFAIAPYGSSNIYQSSVAALNDGGFVVTWTTSTFSRDGNSYNSYGQRYNASGETVGNQFSIATGTDTTYSLWNTSVTALNDGGFFVTWTSEGQDNSGFGIYGQQYDVQGNKVGSEVQINQFTSGDQYTSSPTSVTTLENGNIVVTWSGAGEGDDSGVYSRILTPIASNTPPSIVGQGIEDQIASINSPFSLNISNNFTDVNGDTLTYSATGLPTGFSINTTTGLVSGTIAAPGIFTVNVTANDGKGGTVSDAFDLIVANNEGTAGDDIIYMSQLSTTKKDTVNGKGGSDRIIGTSADEFIGGAEGNDTLDGRGGNDKLLGGLGNDLLIGGLGNDDLQGGSGNDTLIGWGSGTGSANQIDELDGGVGADLYVLGDSTSVFYNLGGNNDYAKILSFKSDDRIQLKGQASDYSLGSVPSSVTPSEAAVGLFTNSGTELIAVFKNESSGTITLTDPRFTFV